MKKKIKKTIKIKNTINDKANAYMVEIQQVAKKLEIKVQPIVNWKKGRPSWLGRFAILLLRISGGFLDTKFTNLEK